MTTASSRAACPRRVPATTLVRRAHRLVTSALVLVGALGWQAPAVAKTIFVAPACPATPKPPCGNNNATGETADAPIASIDLAIQRAGQGGEVRVAIGHYEGPVSLTAGVSVIGGYSLDFKNHGDLSEAVLASKERTLAAYAAQTVLTRDAHGDRVVVSDTSSGGGVLSDLVIIGPNLAGSTDGRSSYGMVVRGTGRVRLRRVKIVAGDGAAGADGRDGASPAPASLGWCGNAGPGGTARAVHKLTRSFCDPRPYGGGCDNVEYYDECESNGGGAGATVRIRTGASSPPAVTAAPPAGGRATTPTRRSTTLTTAAPVRTGRPACAARPGPRRSRRTSSWRKTAS